MSEWISVQDRLPSDAEEFIVTNGKTVSTLEWDGESWFSDIYRCAVNDGAITHWMPLPEPPKR